MATKQIPIHQKLYKFLIENVNKTITHEELIKEVYERVYNVKTQTRTIDVHLIKTKQKLNKEGYLLHRDYGKGFKLLKIVNK